MRLKDVATLNQDSLNENTSPDYTFRYVDISSVNKDGEITFSDPMSFGSSPSRARRKVKKGDVIISTVRTYLRAIAQIEDDNDVIVSTGFAVCSPVKSVSAQYLNYALKSSYVIDQVCANSKGVSYPAIQSSILAQMNIPFVDSHADQQAIADYLDNEVGKLRQRVELLEKKREAYLKLRRAVIERTVTEGLDSSVEFKSGDVKWVDKIPAHWDVQRLERHFHSQTLLNKEYLYKSAFKFYMGTIVPKDETFEDEAYKETYEKYTLVKKDDIIINGLNLNYDLKSLRVGRVQNDGIMTSAYVVLRPYITEESNYYSYLFKAFDYRKFFHGMGKGVRLTLSFNELKTLMIPVPPLSEQRAIAAYLDEKCAKIDAIVANIDRQIERTKQLQRSLINEVITGQRPIN